MAKKHIEGANKTKHALVWLNDTADYRNAADRKASAQFKKILRLVKRFALAWQAWEADPEMMTPTSDELIEAACALSTSVGVDPFGLQKE
jgi:hypothetical protein